MENQHRMINGYRELSEEEIHLMNTIKDLAEATGRIIETLSEREDTDSEALKIAKMNAQQGFMWMVRSVDKPTTFG